MREIKFRIFMKNKNLMDYKFSFSEDCLNKDINDIINLVQNNGNIILMQYTGLKDCNGKEIYEGDILLNDDKYIFYVEFCEYTSDAECQIEINHMGIAVICRKDGKSSLMQIIKDKEKVEIIGNIHENPELLNE